MKTYNHLYENMRVFREFVDELSLDGAEHILIRIHSAIHTKEEMNELAEEIQEILPSAKIIGCSTMQAICEGKLYPSACLISITVFEEAQVRTARINCVDEGGEWKAGNVLAKEMIRDVVCGQEGFLLIFFPLAYSKIEDFVEAVNESGPNLKMLGGAAYLEDEKGNSSRDLAYVLEGTRTSGTEVVMALVSAEKLYSYGEYVCGVEAVGKMCQITSHDCFIDEIDGVDGAEWYANYLGKEALQENPGLANVFPIVKRDRKGVAYYVDYVPGEGSDNKKYYLKSYGELKSGSNVSLGYFHPQKIYDQVKELFTNIGSKPAETIFSYDCQSRMHFLHNCASWEIANFYTTDISGALLSGEISYSKGGNIYANYTFVMTALSEQENSRLLLREKELKNMSELQQDNVQMLNYLLVNANKHLDQELRAQQLKMQDAVFHNMAFGVDNQLKYLYDREQLELDKLALFSLNNERMLKLFSGVTKTYALLKEEYEKIKKYYLTRELYLYSYEDTSILLAGSKNIARTEFLEKAKRIQTFMNGVSCDDLLLSYTVAVVFDKTDSISRIETTLRYAEKQKLSFVCADEIGDVAVRKELEDIHLIRVIKDALLNERVVPFFQEIHNNKGNSKRMYESLIRIFDENGEIYYPNEFLPVAKEYDLYESLSEYMVKTVIDMFWNRDIMVTINLNVQDIYNRKMIQMIFERMQSAPHPENYVFEIIESEEITDYEYIRMFSERVHELGAKIAIDDFGSGFSNLLHVLQIEADYIKIDGGIIRMITEDSHCLDFIRLINGWCAEKKQEVIAEYVENRQLQDIMEDIGVAYSQGYFFSKPHPWGQEDELANGCC